MTLGGGQSANDMKGDRGWYFGGLGMVFSRVSLCGSCILWVTVTSEYFSYYCSRTVTWLIRGMEPRSPGEYWPWYRLGFLMLRIYMCISSGRRSIFICRALFGSGGGLLIVGRLCAKPRRRGRRHTEMYLGIHPGRRDLDAY